MKPEPYERPTDSRHKAQQLHNNILSDLRQRIKKQILLNPKNELRYGEDPVWHLFISKTQSENHTNKN